MVGQDDIGAGDVLRITDCPWGQYGQGQGLGQGLVLAARGG